MFIIKLKRHGKPHGSFGQGTDLYGEGEAVSFMENFQEFFVVVCACRGHENLSESDSI
jgi:hypothetical protein